MEWDSTEEIDAVTIEASIDSTGSSEIVPD